ncbi:hypothetical protein METY_1832 [Methylopila sp. Yamaguchi]|nr:hypothetical protein METY_1832 [Methylopila sp. Yamaguchi]
MAVVAARLRAVPQSIQAGALLSTQPVSWPRYAFNPGVFYSTGTYERVNTSPYNFWHSGAWYWNEPGRSERSANFGAYFAVLRQNVRWVATYAPQPPSGALSEFDARM